MTFLTFIMPVRNVEPFIADAIAGIRSQPFDDWQLIVVDDHSTDATLMLAVEQSANDRRIQVVDNPSRGKVRALDYGYSLSRGDHIKCIDGDDVLLPAFGETIESLACADATYHDLQVVDDALQPTSTFHMGSEFIRLDYGDCLRLMKCLPRCAWTVKRHVADHIFPMPVDLPFEDCWMSLVVKQTAHAVDYIKQPLYKYRQHSEQAFGGVFNYRKDVTIWRSRRILRFLDCIENDGRLLSEELGDGGALLGRVRRYHQLAAREECSLRSILASRLSAKEIAKLVLLKKLPVLAPWVVRQWLHTVKRY